MFNEFRFAKKARIQSHDELAEAFEICSDRFLTESERRKDLDDEVSWSKLPDHLQFLVGLSFSSHSFGNQ